jgi:hypothetical protein
MDTIFMGLHSGFNHSSIPGDKVTVKQTRVQSLSKEGLTEYTLHIVSPASSFFALD